MKRLLALRLRLRSVVRRWVLSWLFTPVRELTLERARVEIGGYFTTVSGMAYDDHSSITLHYKDYHIGIKTFRYDLPKEQKLFESERAILERMCVPWR